jgi:RecB family exonuclease
MPCNFYLSEEDNIILNGLVDWIEYLDDDTLHLIDFKTGKHEEKEAFEQLFGAPVKAPLMQPTPTA